MEYGPFSLVDASGAELRFKLWMNTEQNYDMICAMASVDGSNWYGSCWSGNSGGWVDRRFDLSNVYRIGNLLGRPQVWITLWFSSDSSVTCAEGVYVDNLALRVCPAGVSCPATSSVPAEVDDTLTEFPFAMTRSR
jgi:bacillopeptidase F (M6 metalloprotease family)